MTSAQIKRRRKRAKRILFAIMVVIMFAAARPRIAVIVRLHDQKTALMEQIHQLEQEQQELTATRDSMDRLDTIEKIAREKLGMIKSGERVMVETTDPAAALEPAEPAEPAETAKPSEAGSPAETGGNADTGE